MEGVTSQRRVSDSASAGSVGSEKSAVEERNGHDAMSVGRDDVVSVVPEGTLGVDGVKRGRAQPSTRERQELGGGVEVDEGVFDEVGETVGKEEYDEVAVGVCEELVV